MMRIISADTVITTNIFCSSVDFSPRNILAIIFAQIGTMANTIEPSMEVAKNMAVIWRAIKPI